MALHLQVVRQPLIIRNKCINILLLITNSNKTHQNLTEDYSFTVCDSEGLPTNQTQKLFPKGRYLAVRLH